MYEHINEFSLSLYGYWLLRIVDLIISEQPPIVEKKVEG